MLYIPYSLKHCTKCDLDLPLSTFGRKRSTKDGFRHWCKSCAKQERAHYKKPATDRSEYYRQYHQANRAKKIDSASRWYKTHREQKRQYDSRYYSVRRLNDIAHAKKKATWHRYKARKKSLPAKFTSQQWQDCLNWWNGRCAYCGSQAGLFAGMELNADHFIALCSANCPGTIPTNMLPSCKSCNCSKSNREPFDWLVDHFGERKAKQILTRINAYFKFVNDSQ